jgi:hypothetical protein
LPRNELVGTVCHEGDDIDGTATVAAAVIKFCHEIVHYEN